MKKIILILSLVGFLFTTACEIEDVEPKGDPKPQQDQKEDTSSTD